MLILITNKCNLACKHCMQEASPKGNIFMGRGLFKECLRVAKELGAHVINIAGGEPTITDDFVDYLEDSLSAGFITTLETNGRFVGDFLQNLWLTDLAKKYSSLYIQISSFKEYYANREEVLKALKEVPSAIELKKVMGDRLSVADESNTNLSLMALGRCSKGVMLEKAKSYNRYPSCINSALLAKQIDFKGTPATAFEQHFRFCLPMIDPHGGVHLGESIFCKEICNISDGIERIRERVFNLLLPVEIALIIIGISITPRHLKTKPYVTY